MAMRRWVQVPGNPSQQLISTAGRGITCGLIVSQDRGVKSLAVGRKGGRENTNEKQTISTPAVSCKTVCDKEYHLILNHTRRKEEREGGEAMGYNKIERQEEPRTVSTYRDRSEQGLASVF